MNRLKELRKAKGISLNKIAIVLGVEPTTISYYENGKRSPSIKHLITLSKYFGVSINYLCGMENDSRLFFHLEQMELILEKNPFLYDFINQDPRSAIDKLETFVLQLNKDYNNL